MKEGHDREPAAEDHRAGLGEEPEELPDQRRGGGSAQAAQHPVGQRQKHCAGRACLEGRAHEHDQNAAGEEDPEDLLLLEQELAHRAREHRRRGAGRCGRGDLQRDLVERRRWISRQDYLEGLALAQLAPGPLAAQLAIYLGWVRARIAGATLVSLAFIAPSLLMVLAISALYVRYGGLPWMQGVFYGIGAAVIAIIARSAVKLVRLTLQRDTLLWAVFAVSAAVTGYTRCRDFHRIQLRESSLTVDTAAL